MPLNKHTGVILLNLGTPDNSSVGAVRRYLNQFLYDRRVIELPTFLRWLLVKCIIVPFRAKKSAHAYAKIWQADGSPLLINSLNIKQKLAQSLGDNYTVSLGMRYGNPSIKSAVVELQDAAVDHLIVLPLFPQYSSAATGSALEDALSHKGQWQVIPDLTVKQSYFQNSSFIHALSASVRPYLQQEYDFLLMSYHGLPERQMVHGKDPQCDLQHGCPAINKSNANCYRAQCYQTSRLLAQSLNLPVAKWGIGFQSRLGRLPWIKPYTDEVLVELRQQGISKLVVCCPSFVADCLETLEEIGIRAKEQWFALGGSELRLVPCLNDQDAWIDCLKSMVITAQ